MARKKKSWEPPRWLLLVLALIFLFRIPSFFEPYYYGDELIYLTLGEGIRRGVTLFSEIHDNKPPLLYLTAAIAGNVFWFRVILAGWMMATTVLFWKLVTHLVPKEKKLQIIAVVAFAILTTIPLLEGPIANAELFMIGPTIWAFLLLLGKKLTNIKVLAAGILFAIATLFKVPAAVDIAAIVFLWLVLAGNKKLNTRVFARRLVFLGVGFAIPIVLTFAVFGSQGALNEYLTAAFGQNIGYLSSFRPADQTEPFLSRNGPLLTRGVVTAAILAVLYITRNRLSKTFLFVAAWLAVSLFAVTLSERPYPHYLVQSVPSIAIFIGFLAAKKNWEQALAVIPLFVAVAAPVFFNFWYYDTADYYGRFLAFATGNVSREEYFAQFDPAVPRNYKLAQFITSTTRVDDPIFVWADSPGVYALSRRLPPIRYVAGYHITNFSSPEEVVSSLAVNQPELIIILPNSPPFPELRQLVSSNYFLVENIEGADVYKKASSTLQTLLRE